MLLAGGATIQMNNEGESSLKQMANGEKMERQDIVIGRGDLTVGRDQVELSRPERVHHGRGKHVFSSSARTMYFHALSGSVLHTQLVDANGQIYWVWVGAGGKGFNSKEINNFTAIDLDLGMWPDLAKTLMKFCEDPEVMKLFPRSGCGESRRADQADRRQRQRESAERHHGSFEARGR